MADSQTKVKDVAVPLLELNKEVKMDRFHFFILPNNGSLKRGESCKNGRKK
jgi:hypothetical protein